MRERADAGGTKDAGLYCRAPLGGDHSCGSFARGELFAVVCAQIVPREDGCMVLWTAYMAMSFTICISTRKGMRKTK